MSGKLLLTADNSVNQVGGVIGMFFLGGGRPGDGSRLSQVPRTF